jgi:ubiquinone/menaquinone biosynthesis C-methylase UbiE
MLKVRRQWAALAAPQPTHTADRWDLSMSSSYTATDAQAYEQLMGRWSARLADQLIAFAGLEPGDRVLDLGCGTGSMALAVAAHPEPAAIVGIDIASPYVAYAAERSGDPRLTFLVGDAVAFDLPAASFDRSFSLLALNFMSDPASALQGMRWVTRPGGIIAAAVWDFAGGLVYQRLFWDTAAAIDPDADRARSRHFSSPLIRPGELADAFEDAGLRKVRSASLTIRMEYADFSDYWEPIANAQGPVGDYVKRLPPDRLGTIAAAVRRAYLAGQPDGPRSMAATAWAARGLVP